MDIAADCQLPADVLEGASPRDGIIAQRMGGARQLSWLPLNLGALLQTHVEQFGYFLVCFSGSATVGSAVQDWVNRQVHPVMHIAAVATEGALAAADFTMDQLRDYCRMVLERRGNAFTPDRQAAAARQLAEWQEHEPVPSGLKGWAHNVVLPNHMVLTRAGRSLEPGEAFVGRSEADYASLIVESAQAVRNVRQKVGLWRFHRAMLLHPALILTEPALYRQAYARPQKRSAREERELFRVLRLLQTQTGHLATAHSDFFEILQNRPGARFLLHLRQWELEAHTLGVGLKAAQTCSAVLRLSPAVNHVFPALSAYARNIRSANAQSRRKARRLFETVQQQLVSAIGPERLAFIADAERPMKIVADAPIEWLPVNGLPLGLRFDCSRINATPGNLMMGLLTQPDVVTVPPAGLQKVLILSCLTADDPLRNALLGSVNAIRHQWEGKVEVVVKRALTKQAFIDALNEFDGSILIFDGHGAINNVDPVGYLVVGNEKMDVWSLRGHVKIPPIVILSACDTQGIDSGSHATVGNGFLALGARAVLATLLPVGGLASGAFIARLIYRLADFLPAMIATRARVLNWTEVIAGMLRMLFASEVLDALVGPPAPLASPRGQIQRQANMDINSGDPAWFENLVDHVSAFRNEDRTMVEGRIRDVIAQCEAIRYVQLGNPETILIDDGTIRDAVLGTMGDSAPDSEVTAS
ncbi:CHAT domain-containing protein [Chelativorans salis]|uniref:CHAT domain-containing protein n=1 Tax=Chelativorans salis TaxID=2978478 RepID=A0ABT2LQR9_9HYPH|nr:CHAT domain-containing protein [Chelativorans sp. EGI FJ00035]MCT7376897.1 CHAT domain-containing protein [Chelativorans sp. EGI FJ00035]